MKTTFTRVESLRKGDVYLAAGRYIRSFVTVTSDPEIPDPRTNIIVPISGGGLGLKRHHRMEIVIVKLPRAHG